MHQRFRTPIMGAFVTTLFVLLVFLSPGPNIAPWIDVPQEKNAKMMMQSRKFEKNPSTRLRCGWYPVSKACVVARDSASRVHGGTSCVGVGALSHRRRTERIGRTV